MRQCWIHSLVFRGGCDLCVAWAYAELVINGDVYVRRTQIGLVPIMAISATRGGDELHVWLPR